MSRATSKPISRRAALKVGTAIAASAVLGGATAAALTAEADPIFALIEAHRTALRSHDDAFTRNQDLTDAFIDANTVPRDVWENDPRLIESMRECDGWYKKQTEIAATIGKTIPTTAAGAIALLAYSAKYVGSGLEAEIIDWPTADVFRNTAAAIGVIAEVRPATREEAEERLLVIFSELAPEDQGIVLAAAERMTAGKAA